MSHIADLATGFALGVSVVLLLLPYKSKRRDRNEG